jgi:hypothetical protein
MIIACFFSEDIGLSDFNGLLQMLHKIKLNIESSKQEGQELVIADFGLNKNDANHFKAFSQLYEAIRIAFYETMVSTDDKICYIKITN